MNPLGTAFCQKVFDRLTAMDCGSIPDHQEFAGDLSQEQLQEANHVRAFVRMVLGLHEYPSFWSDATDGREMVTGQFDSYERRLAHRSIRAYSHRQEIKGRLIYKHDGPFFVFGLFFSASQRSSFQVWIAASSRCVAFWIGFC